MRPHLGTVYLLHFDRPYRHARHYVGFTTNLKRRLSEHRSGHGSPLLCAVVEAGIRFRVARLWLNVTRRFERRLHNLQPRWKHCPYCTFGVAGRALPRPSDFEPSLRKPREEHPGEPEVLRKPVPELFF